MGRLTETRSLPRAQAPAFKILILRLSNEKGWILLIVAKIRK